MMNQLNDAEEPLKFDFSRLGPGNHLCLHEMDNEDHVCDCKFPTNHAENGYNAYYVHHGRSCKFGYDDNVPKSGAKHV